MANFTANRFNWLLISLVIILISIGLVTLYSLNPHLFQLQLIAVVIGLGLLIAISQIPFLFLVNLAPVIYGLNLLLLIAVLFFPAIKGAHRWLALANNHLQPSEFLKISLVLTSWWLINKMDKIRLKPLVFKILVFLLFLIPLGLVVIEPDLGTFLFLALSFSLAWLPFLFKFKTLAGGTILIILLAPFLWYQLKPYQQQRLTSFLNPLMDPYKSGYNIIQAQLAISNGGLAGKINSAQKYQNILPEAQTDFIFSAWIEDTGLIGGFILITIYSWLLRQLYLAGRFLESAEKIPLILIIMFLPIEAMFHMAINLQLLPVTGIPLPFISYGRSAMVSSLILIGLLLSRLKYLGKITRSPVKELKLGPKPGQVQLTKPVI